MAATPATPAALPAYADAVPEVIYPTPAVSPGDNILNVDAVREATRQRLRDVCAVVRLDYDDAHSDGLFGGDAEEHEEYAALDAGQQYVVRIVSQVHEKINANPEVVIGFVGDRGVGKSSLINWLVGVPDLMPTGAAAPATAAITEVKGWNRTDYEMAVAFMSKREWADACAKVKADLREEFSPTPETLLLSLVEGTSVAAAAFRHLISSVEVLSDGVITRDVWFDAPFSEYDELCAVGNFTPSVVEKMEAGTLHQRFDSSSLHELKSAVWTYCGKGEPDGERAIPDDYEYNSDDDSDDGVVDPGPAPAERFWPIVSRVRLRGNFPGLIGRRATLVDIPGSSDGSEESEARFRTGVQLCTHIYYMVNETTRLGEDYYENILKSGEFNNCELSFVIPKADRIGSSAAEANGEVKKASKLLRKLTGSQALKVYLLSTTAVDLNGRFNTSFYNAAKSETEAASAMLEGVNTVLDLARQTMTDAEGERDRFFRDPVAYLGLAVDPRRSSIRNALSSFLPNSYARYNTLQVWLRDADSGYVVYPLSDQVCRAILSGYSYTGVRNAVVAAVDELIGNCDPAIQPFYESIRRGLLNLPVSALTISTDSLGPIITASLQASSMDEDLRHYEGCQARMNNHIHTTLSEPATLHALKDAVCGSFINAFGSVLRRYRISAVADGVIRNLLAVTVDVEPEWVPAPPPYAGDGTRAVVAAVEAGISLKDLIDSNPEYLCHAKRKVRVRGATASGVCIIRDGTVAGGGLLSVVSQDDDDAYVAAEERGVVMGLACLHQEALTTLVLAVFRPCGDTTSTKFIAPDDLVEAVVTRINDEITRLATPPEPRIDFSSEEC